MEEDSSDDDAQPEWYNYKIGDKNFTKLRDMTSHPGELKTATHVRIEASTLPNNAFFRFQALMSVDLMLGLQEIGDRAFQYCSSLQFVSIPPTVRVIGCRAFQQTKLTTVTIPKSTSVIKPRAFYLCESLVHVDLAKDASLEILEEFIFENCYKLRCFHVPVSVKHIREGAFLRCTGLQTIEFPIGILSLGDGCFNVARELSNMIIPPTVNFIGDHLFDGADAIQKAVLNDDNNYDDHIVQEDFLDDGNINKYLVKAMEKRFDGLTLHKLFYYHPYSPLEASLNDVQNCSSDYNKADMFGMTAVHILAASTEPHVKLFQELAKWVPPKAFTSRDEWDIAPVQYLIDNTMPGAEESINFFIQYTLVDRSKGLGLDRWKREIAEKVEQLDTDAEFAILHLQFDTAYATLEKLELIESTSLVEIVLWSMRMDEAKKVSPNVDRLACRISCGADIVILNVLVFLQDET